MLNADQCELIKTQAKTMLTKLEWGTRGRNMDEPVRPLPLCELSTPHLENILISQPFVAVHYKAAILMLLRERYAKNDLTES